MKRYALLVAVAFFLTVRLASAFAGEANQMVKAENKGLTKTAQRSYILADDGTVLTRLYIENREDVPLESIPKYVQNAFIAIEDERFYEHHGVDFYGISRAFLANIRSGKIVEGGSTITQQYVKLSLGNTERTYSRKIREAILASKLERKYTKQQILEAYLNTIYFGQGAYGVEAASEVFFNKKVGELNLSEAALLAGITKAPDLFSPYTHPEAAYQRQAIVLDKMVEQGYITRAEAEAAKQNRPQLAPIKPEPVIAPYFVEYVKQQLIKEYGVEKVFKGGLRVYTTLNIRAQNLAQDAINSTLNLPKDPQAALVSIVPQNGHIIAMVGGRDFSNIKYNLAVQGKRQPGSAFKPFVLITALKQGYGPNDVFDSSSPKAIQIGKPGRYNPPWIVHNSEGSGYGAMTLREATVKSVNAVYAQLVVKVGPQNVADTAHSMGITTRIDPYPAIGIGGLTVGVSPLEMASAYGTIANGGAHVKPVSITKITDAKGNIIKQTKTESSQALDPQIAYRAIDIMKGVIERGTATRANIGRPAAGKTGTNEEYRDAWFVGFTPNLVTSVWMGYPEAQVSMYNVHGSRGYGGIIPATIWHKFMQAQLAGTPALDWPAASWPESQSQNTNDASVQPKNYDRRSLRKSTTTTQTTPIPPTTNPPAPPTTNPPAPPTTNPPAPPTTNPPAPPTTQQQAPPENQINPPSTNGIEERRMRIIR
ncbi:MAG: PBP1A family penicillin-binding protein [Firmicutes bacterium]|nr:PBP1A family penicillin-binding protein [Bacillota bacterium]